MKRRGFMAAALALVAAPAAAQWGRTRPDLRHIPPDLRPDRRMRTLFREGDYEYLRMGDSYWKRHNGGWENNTLVVDEWQRCPIPEYYWAHKRLPRSPYHPYYYQPPQPGPSPFMAWWREQLRKVRR